MASLEWHHEVREVRHGSRYGGGFIRLRRIGLLVTTWLVLPSLVLGQFEYRAKKARRSIRE